MSNDRPEWFSAKRYGFGAGLPIAWQGWLLLVLYLAIVLGAACLFAERPVILLSIIIPASVIFIVIAARTTRGGMRWRWGGD